MEELKVGLTVWLKPCRNNTRYGINELREYKIKKIARKYFEVWKNDEENSIVKFNIEDYIQATDYTPIWKFYLSKQDILDEQETIQLIIKIRNKFVNYGRVTLSLDQLRRIDTIIDE